ncbi:MAG: hypothetical protein WCV92_01795 [Candidatus Buchananbacteria bacterium]
MAFTETQQISELIKKSNSILITLKRDWSGDALAASLSLGEFLKNAGKKVSIVCDNFSITSNISFLPAYQIRPNLGNLQKFVISVNTNNTKLNEVSYDQQDDKLNIYITPEDGTFEEKDIKTFTSDYQYDLIFILGSPDLSSLGTIYDNNADFFYAKPKINVDHSPLNEYFGNINLVNIASSSTSEIIYDLLKELDREMIDDNIATYLLGGIIMSTKNFKTLEVTPRTLNMASELINKGARREQIIQNLYQSRYISTLKLWGRVLSRLKNDFDDRIVWSALSANDFLETSTSPEDLQDVIDELIITMPKTEIIFLIYQSDKSANCVEAIIYSTKKLDASAISQAFNPIGNKEIARFTLKDVSLAQAERMIIEEVKKKISCSVIA